MRKASLALAMAALCTLGSVASAEAAGKQRIVVERGSDSYEFTIDCRPFGPYEFDILVSGREHVTVTEVVAEDGTPQQTVFRIRFAETATNSETGATLPLKAAVHEVWDLGAGTRTLSGKVFIGTQPGTGSYVQDTGRITLTLDTDEPVFVAGPHEAFFGDLDAIQCAALAQAS